DELPEPIVGLELIEPPHKRFTLSARPVSLDRLCRHASIVSLVTTHACKFHCAYCPIPAYNQFTFRWKSRARLRVEIETIAEKTGELFRLLNQNGICPMSMMMHHDGQPLHTRGNLYGLLNQVRFLRRAGSVSLQVTILTPSVGSKGYEEPFESGMVIEEAAGQ